MSDIRLINGDCLGALKGLPGGRVHCVVTSPPYYALRAYLPKDDPLKEKELGQEKSPDCLGWATGGRCGECYVCRMTAVFREVRRVLRDDGTLWLNIAGSYNAYNGNRGKSTSFSSGTEDACPQLPGGFGLAAKGWKAKDYINVPALLAESLRADGWYLRAEIALTKVAPMPESCRDRPTRATEKLYLLSKMPAYFYDQEAERVALTAAPHAPGNQKWADNDRNDGSRTQVVWGSESGRNLWDWWDDATEDLPPNVWEWRPEASGLDHYASFPTWLPKRCISLGTSLKGCCPKCGAPLVREVTKKKIKRDRPRDFTKRDRSEGQGNACPNSVAGVSSTTTGWSPSCQCGEDTFVPCTVLDPFLGSGTTGMVARQMGRSFVGIELNPKYLEIAQKRIHRGRAPKKASRSTKAGFLPEELLK